MGSAHPRCQGLLGRGAGGHRHGQDALTLEPEYEAELRGAWWGAVASLARLTGNLELAEDSVQDACVAALVQWPRTGVPASPKAWLVGVARHKAVDRTRRESRRAEKEAATVRQLLQPPDAASGASDVPGDDLWLIYLCCHPALDSAARVALTLRSVAGLTTSEIAAAFLVPEPTMAKRLVRAKQKIRESAMAFRLPAEDLLETRTRDVLRIINLVFSEGHLASSGEALIRPDLCARAIELARNLRARLPQDAEVAGLLALLLLTHARQAARADATGAIVLLEDQERRLWDRAMIDEGDDLLVWALGQGRPGPFQLWAAIAACHSTATSPAGTDWDQIALLYQELLAYEATPVVEANRAIAVAMADGPAAGLEILDRIVADPLCERWGRVHLARADLLYRLDRNDQAIAAWRRALELAPSAAERAFIVKRINSLVPAEC